MTEMRSTCIIALLLMLAAPQGVSAANSPRPFGEGQQPIAQSLADTQEQKISTLTALILATLAANAKESRAQLIEGRLTFAIDQAQSKCSVTKAALERVSGMESQMAQAAKLALSRMRASVERCRGDGTASLADARSVITQGTTLGLAGGTSNYISQ